MLGSCEGPIGDERWGTTEDVTQVIGEAQLPDTAGFSGASLLRLHHPLLEMAYDVRICRGRVILFLHAVSHLWNQRWMILIFRSDDMMSHNSTTLLRSVVPFEQGEKTGPVRSPGG